MVGFFFLSEERICLPVGPSLQRNEGEEEEERGTALYSRGKLGCTTLCTSQLELTMCVGGGVKQYLASPLEPTPLKQAPSCCHLQHCEKLHRYYISLSTVKIPES